MDAVIRGLNEIRGRMAAACDAAGRSRHDVALIAVSKRQPLHRVDALVEAGVRAFGENQIQAWRTRSEGRPELDWHVIGPIQRNKARFVLEHPVRPAMVHTIDSARLVAACDTRHGSQAGGGATLAPLPALIQVNVDAEPQKAGCGLGDLSALADIVAASPALSLRGVMAIPAPQPTAEGMRRAFATTRQAADVIADRVEEPNKRVVISMGMSSDFHIAIAEGATLVRVGTALFGPRDLS